MTDEHPPGTDTVDVDPALSLNTGSLNSLNKPSTAARTGVSSSMSAQPHIEAALTHAGDDNSVRRAAQHRAQAIQALDMRLMGATLDQIGQALSIHRDLAGRYITKLLAERSSPARIEDAREQELLRLDKLLLAWGPRSTSANPDPRAADIYLRIQERRSRLLGLDAPQRVDIGTLVRELALAEGWDVERALEDAHAMAKALPPGERERDRGGSPEPEA